MLPEIPNLTKCEKCNSIFFLSDLEPIASYDKYGEISEDHEKYSNLQYFKFLDIYDLIRALELYPQEEKYIRMRIWWGFNDRIRNEESNNEEIFLNDNDKQLYEDNCNKLIELLDIENINEKMITAELNRNLENFDKCLAIIDNLPDDLNVYKVLFNESCLQKNKYVFKIEFEE
jgi:curved DNA-binding protein CbpA